MDDHLNRGIKAIIDEFPRVAEALDEYGIACGPCSVGTCLLKDIVKIHNLTSEVERELMDQIDAIISGREPAPSLAGPAAKESLPGAPRKISYSPPMQRLVNEHVFIMRVVEAIPELVDRFDMESGDDRQLVGEVTDFIRNYADRYHHAKEEDILFKYFDEDDEILRTMHAEHEKGRGHVRATLDALDKRDRTALVEHLRAYHDLLKEHIKKEDEILYVWMDGSLSTRQVGELFSKFGEVEEKFGGAPREYEAFAGRLEAGLKGSPKKEGAIA